MMTDQERMNYWWRRAKAAEEKLAEAWEDGAQFGFETSYEGYNGEYIGRSDLPNWRKDNPYRRNK